MAEELRLKTKYDTEVVPALIKRFEYITPQQAPRLKAIVLNMGLGPGGRDAKLMDSLRDNLTIIAGQRPVVTRARKSIANFKVREGMPVGLRVTLRRERMYAFLDRLISLALPRVRDFRGVNPKSFDGRGNYAMGLQEQLIWPEIDYDKVTQVQGMDVVFVTTARTDEEGRELLRLLGMPFRTN